jgi:hypothetical protein
VRGIAQIPLLLSFLCRLYLEGRDKPKGDRPDLTRLRRTDLYRIVLRRLLSGEWKMPPRQLKEGQVDRELTLLKPAAFWLFLAGREQFKRDELLQALQFAYAKVDPHEPQTVAKLTSHVEKWTEEDGVLVKAGAGENVPFLFLHLTFQEYLGACYLAERINASGWESTVLPFDTQDRTASAREFVDRKAWLPEWQEVIVLLAGNLKDPVPLLELLTDEAKDDMFRHRLALAALCLPEIEALLDETGRAGC